MVQLHEDGGNLTSKAHWWKLKDHKTDTTSSRRWTPEMAMQAARDYLFDHGFSSKSTTNLQRLLYSCTRADRGMLCYERCNITELRAFCQARNIKGFRSKSKVDTIDKLEAADEARVFDKFLDLPAELRLAVYEYAFDSTANSSRIDLAPPPLTQVSQLLRVESMPIFYGAARLRLQCALSVATFPLSGQDYRVLKLTTFFAVDDPGHPRCYWNEASNFFYGRPAPLSILQAITSFNFEVSLPVSITLPISSTNPVHSSTKWKIDLPSNGNPYNVKRLDPDDDTPQLAANSIATLEAHIKSCVASMSPATTGGPITLKRSDYAKITNADVWEDGDVTYGDQGFEYKTARLREHNNKKKDSEKKMAKYLEGLKQWVYGSVRNTREKFTWRMGK